jgi:branched-chain amino acid transport system substrate-binding protein
MEPCSRNHVPKIANCKLQIANCKLRILERLSSSVFNLRFAICHLPYAIFFLALAVTAGCGTPSPPPPILIGHVAPRSGPQRDYGIQAEQGILLAVQEANEAEDQVAGRSVTVIHTDSQGNPEAAQSEAVRLLSVSRVAGLLGGSNPVAAERLCRTVQQYKVPLITPTWLPASALGPYGFSIGMTPIDQGKALAQVAGKKLQAEQIAVLTDSRSPAAIALTAAFTESIGKPAIVLQLEYDSSSAAAGPSPEQQPAPDNDKKFAALAAKVAAAKPRVILLAGASSDLGKFRAEMQKAQPEANLSILFGGDEDEKLAELADSNTEANELYWTTAFVIDGSQPKAKEFADKFEKNFHRPPDSAAAQAYDSARLLFEAIRQVKTTKGDKVREQLLNTKDFDSLTGPISFDKTQAAQRVVFVVRRQNKKTVLVSGP